MASEIRAEAVFKGGMRFEGVSHASGKTVALDFVPAGLSSKPDGFTPVELMLTSLAACSGQVVVGLLKKMGQDVRGLTVRASGVKRDAHPMVLASAELVFELHGVNLDPSSVERAVFLSEDRYCPVWNMLKAGVPITSSFKIFEV
jgi:putative redox protein